MTLEEIIKAQIGFEMENSKLHNQMAIDEEGSEDADWFKTIATAEIHAANVLRHVLREAEFQGLI